MYYTLAKILSTFCPFPKTTKENEIKGSELIDQAEEISEQPNVLVRLVVRICQKVEQKIVWKNFDCKRTIYEVGAEKGVDVKEISNIKKDQDPLKCLLKAKN